jgi:3'-5' exoribonuclease
MKLCHILLAHHGRGDYNSPVSPEFPEAALVYYADELDAKLFQYLRLKEEAETEDFHVYSKRLGQIYLK